MTAKKMIAVLLTLALALALAACTAPSSPDSSAPSTGSGSSSSDSSSSSDAQAPSSASSGSDTAAGGGEQAGSSQQTDPQEEASGGILVAYFSKTGTTQGVAQTIQQLVGGDLFEIEPAEAYPEDYTETTEIALQEQQDNARPALASSVEGIDQYDVVFIGYPIWWGDMPMAVCTFLESYDLSGKTVIPFCTSGGSSIEGSLATVTSLCPNSTVLEGLTANNDADIEPWLTSIGLL